MFSVRKCLLEGDVPGGLKGDNDGGWSRLIQGRRQTSLLGKRCSRKGKGQPEKASLQLTHAERLPSSVPRLEPRAGLMAAFLPSLTLEGDSVARRCKTSTLVPEEGTK